MSGYRLSIAAALLLGGVACGWTSGGHIEAVWSDDDALFALVVLQYEHPDTNTHAAKNTRNERSQMFVVDSELNDAATPVGGES